MATTPTRPNIGQISESMATTGWSAMKRSFQRFTTPTIASQILQSCLPELSTSSFEVSDCTILDAKLKTYLKPASKMNSTLSACYHLTLRERSAGQSSQRIVYVKVFLGGRSREVFRFLTRNGMSDSEFEYAVTHVPEHDLILWRFPHDPALPHLRQLVDLLAVEQHLPSEGLSQIGIQGTPQVLARHLVNYRPEIRCTNRYDLYDSNHDQTCQLFGKTFRDREGQSLHKRLQYFWDRSLADPDAMAVAQPLGYTAAVNTVWQFGVSGTPLLQVLNPLNYKHYISAVARGLASLHTSGLAGLATHSPDDHLLEIRKKLTKLADAIPQLSETFGTMADHFEQAAPHSSAIPFRPIHWDFHVDQLLVDKGRLIFCDLDELINGDPIQDLANFLVDLRFRNIDAGLVRLMAAELYDSYRQQVGWGVPVKRLVWHARLQFINKAYRHYLRFAPGFERIVGDIIRLAEGELTLW
ncbi:MAG: aminoglycoside phosphotransferase family protein [Nitrospirota bacterium]